MIDSGATTFIPLVDYLKENDAIEYLKSQEMDVYMHIPIVGGQAKDDTILGLVQLVEAFDCKFIVWINEYHGALVDFEKTEQYKVIKDKIRAIITLSSLSKDTFGKDLLELTSKNMTFDEALQDKSFSLMSKQRLKIFRDKAFNQIKAVL